MHPPFCTTGYVSFSAVFKSARAWQQLTSDQDAVCVALAGFAFYRVGLTPCKLATATAPIGSKLTVAFTVYDDGVPPLQASVNRTLLVTSPCSEGMQLLLQTASVDTA